MLWEKKELTWNARSRLVTSSANSNPIGRILVESSSLVIGRHMVNRLTWGTIRKRPRLDQNGGKEEEAKLVRWQHFNGIKERKERKIYKSEKTEEKTGLFRDYSAIWVTRDGTVSSEFLRGVAFVFGHCFALRKFWPTKSNEIRR